VPLLARRPPAAEQVQRAVQALRQLGERERRQSPGGQLDRQRHPVEVAHQLGDEPQLRTGRGEPGPDPGGAVQEHGDRRDLGQLGVGSVAGQR
jgi:hypothetical protein